MWWFRNRQLDRIERGVNALLIATELLMKADQQVLDFLAQLNTYTNQLAAAEEAQTAKITEIAEDIDALLAGGDTGLTEETVTKLAAASESLKAIADFETAQAETLTNIAAKNDNPLPPPTT